MLSYPQPKISRKKRNTVRVNGRFVHVKNMERDAKSKEREEIIRRVVKKNMTALPLSTHNKLITWVMTREHEGVNFRGTKWETRKEPNAKFTELGRIDYLTYYSQELSNDNLYFIIMDETPLNKKEIEHVDLVTKALNRYAYELTLL